MKNLRKLIAGLMIIGCLFAFAYAETVPSPTKPAAVVSQVVTTSEVETETPLVIAVVETEQWSETAVAEYEEINQVLADPEAVPTDIFTEEEIATVSELLPEEYDVNNLTVAEYIPMNIENYVPEIGDAAIQLTLPGEYTEEDVLVAVFKPFNGDESSWIALEAKVVIAEEAAAETEDGAAVEVTSNIEVLFTQEVLEMISANEGALLILRGTIE